jgi:hypothetical protein
MVKRIWKARVLIVFIAAMAGLAMLAQACGGGSTEADVTPTAKPLPTLAPDSETPVASERSDVSGPEAGVRGQLARIGGPSEEFAAFLGISQAQLESELSAEGATPGSVAEAHGHTRDELRAFLIG